MHLATTHTAHEANEANHFCPFGSCLLSWMGASHSGSNSSASFITVNINVLYLSLFHSMPVPLLIVRSDASLLLAVGMLWFHMIYGLCCPPSFHSLTLCHLFRFFFFFSCLCGPHRHSCVTKWTFATFHRDCLFVPTALLGLGLHLQH